MSIDIFNKFTSKDLIPERDPGAMTGSEFVKENFNIVGNVRETNILNEFLYGNIPGFLKNFSPIKVTIGANTITYIVMPDYLSIGTDKDYVRMPMSPLTAQKIADKYDCTLPTKKMVNDIWKNSINKLEPQPQGSPYTNMDSMDRIHKHNTTIQKQLSNYYNLTSGHKKDVVLTNKLYPNNINKKVAIYGWIKSSGLAIQGLNASDHSDTYIDYSHGIRLIANDVMINGNPMRIQDIFRHEEYCSLISDEITMEFLRY
jgi:hypothetical protein